ncbi:20758_t:CDS:2 [Dentiscutata erythropus]|uniref:20758_t:CDS:1 n=1 Tax=Dentiscutata erythropus TaxID=1348616 RepID=A0A9N9FCK5_9GLOM|nr:20758_t:CDS:2 [Dentiscutata erythropus]
MVDGLVVNVSEVSLRKSSEQESNINLCEKRDAYLIIRQLEALRGCSYFMLTFKSEMGIRCITLMGWPRICFHPG